MNIFILCREVSPLNNTNIPLMIVGDAASPTLPWLMWPYTGACLSEIQENFNFHHSSARIVVENAFGRLKAWWRILQRLLDVNINDAPTIIGATCILNSVATLLWRKTPEFTLKKKQKTIKNFRHTKCLKKSKANLKCTLAVLAHKN